MLLTLIAVYLSLAMALEDNATTDFGDLGKLLAGGVLVAVVLAVGFTLLRMRVRDKKPSAPDFISIYSTRQDSSDYDR